MAGLSRPREWARNGRWNPASRIRNAACWGSWPRCCGHGRSSLARCYSQGLGASRDEGKAAALRVRAAAAASAAPFQATSLAAAAALAPSDLWSRLLREGAFPIGAAPAPSEQGGARSGAYRQAAAGSAPSGSLQLSSDAISLVERLDALSYRTITVGFLLLSVGLVSGAVWANEAWGSWWSWDPKETWALICWLVYAAYLHTRLIRGWQGRRPALVASAGLVVIAVCYIGVNLLGIGLHSYGWFFDS